MQQIVWQSDFSQMWSRQYDIGGIAYNLGGITSVKMQINRANF